MGSAFLTSIHLVLSLYCIIQLFKNAIQFGLPNHPARITLYLVLLCVTAFFGMQALADLNFIDPFFYMRWRVLPMIAGGLGFLLQIVSIVGQFSFIQQKIISRIPIIGSLLIFTFFHNYSQLIFSVTIFIAVLYLAISVRNHRYQKRIITKMSIFLVFYVVFRLPNIYGLHILSELFLFLSLFYFFIFQHCYGISALVEDLKFDLGVSK